MEQIIGAVAAPIISGLFGGGKSAPAPAPIVEPPKPMPTVDSAAVLAAKKKSIAAVQQRGGRASTILTDTGAGSDTLGA